MPPYGNCFFAGLAHQLGENHLDMGVIAKHRGELCDYIELNEEEMKPFISYTADNNNDDNYENDCAMELAVQNSRFTEHCRTMRLVDEVEGVFSNHAWATNAEVQAASVVYGLNILIYEVASDGILRLYNSIGKKGDHEISLLYDGQHYDSLIPEADHTALTMEESMTTMHSTTTHSTLMPTTSSHTTLLPTTTRDDELMKSDKDEKEGCQTSGPNSLVAEDSGFEELGDSNVKQPAMTIADYCMQISKDDTFITPFEDSVQGKLVDDETSARLIQQVQSFWETPSPIVQPRPEFADKVLQKAKDGHDDKTFLTCTIDPAAWARKPSNGHASVSTWPLPQGQNMATDSSEQHPVIMTKEDFSRHAQCDDIGPGKIRVAETGKIQLLDAVASSDGNPNSPSPSACDVIPGHRHTGKNHNVKPGTVKKMPGDIIGQMMVRELLRTHRTMYVDGKAAIEVLAEVILSDKDLTLTLLSDAQLVEICTAYYPMRHENGMFNHNAMIIFDNKTKNVCFVLTSYQLVSAAHHCLFTSTQQY